ncbi:NUDIX hydrolase [Halobaculum roseum]|uniref:NUDIX hydrolase n=1 Tax=Halobaculum roseum TaxID=2175149 RepID=A0ABD5MMF6_9EURY|nr:NUDIX hydrolase [Halobaculum roseum]QZY02791.1 NUDIX hydrolase [Halobaculum roseum]
MSDDPAPSAAGAGAERDDPADRPPDGRPARDPRREYDDLIVNRVESTRSPEELRRLRADNEAIREGWVAAGVVLDPADRVLVVDLADRGWALPGGTALPDEPLAATAEREVREESGVVADAVRPHAVHDEVIAAADGSVPETPFRVVHFELRAREPTVADDPAALGDDDETVRAVEWREGLPEEIYGDDWTKRVYERIVG